MCEDFIKLPEDEVASLGRLKEMSVVLIDCDGEGRVTHDDGGFEDIDNLIGCEIDDVYLRVWSESNTNVLIAAMMVITWKYHLDGFYVCFNLS